MQVTINVGNIFNESVFFMEWSEKCKNKKTKRRLILKAQKELNRVYLDKIGLERRIRNQLNL